MPFCPSCRTEYQAGTELCGECQTQLVDHLDDRTDRSDLVDVYVCYDEQIADRAVALLEDNGIEVLIRDHSSSAFPVTVGEATAQFVAVAASQRQQAQKLLSDAIADTVLTGDGHLLES